MNLGQMIGELQLRIDELEGELAERVLPTSCETCERVRALLLGDPVRRKDGNQHMTVDAIRGVSRRIRAVLAESAQPLRVRDIARLAGLPRIKVATNIPHLVRRGVVMQSGERGSYRYTLPTSRETTCLPSESIQASAALSPQ